MWFLGLLIMLALAFGGGVALAAVRPDLFGIDGDSVEVNVRAGEARLDGSGDALVVIGPQLLQSLVEEAVAEAQLPYELTDIGVSLAAEGILLSGTVRVRELGVTVTPSFTTTVFPYAQDGAVAVTVERITAVGVTVPGELTPLVEGAINRQLREATAIEGYAVQDVEMGSGELLVYLDYTGLVE